MSEMGMPDDGMFTVMSTLLPLMFIFVIGFFIFVFVKGISEWRSNNQQPILTVMAKIVAKRQRVSGGSGDSAASTSYYLTFEVSSGDRLEFAVSGKDFGMLAEGDTGELSFQGTRYKEFNRQR